MKRLIFASLCAFFFALIFSAHHVYAQALRKVQLTIPVDALDSMAVYLAQVRGYFADEGLDVQVTATGGGGPDIMAVIAGSADFTFTDGGGVILSYQEGKRLLMVSSGVNRVTLNWGMHKDVAKAKGITEKSPLKQRLKALKGLTVGVTRPGAFSANLASYVIRRAGYDPQKDVKMIAVGFGPTAVAALENRKADIVIGVASEMAVSRGFGIMFLNHSKESSLISEYPQLNLITRPEVVEKDPDLVRKMARALIKASRWALSSPPEQVAEALKPFLGKNVEPAFFLQEVKRFLLTLSPDGRISERSVQIMQDLLEQAGVLKKRAVFSEIVTNDFLPR